MWFLPGAAKLGQGNVFTGVCDSVNRGALPQCMLGYHNHPPRADTPPQSRHHLQSRHPPGADTPPEQTHPPGPDTPQSRHAHTPRPDTPPEADSGIRSTSGRYASYWNAFLLLTVFFFLRFLFLEDFILGRHVRTMGNLKALIFFLLFIVQ